MKRPIVCLSFDFDTMAPFIARGMTSTSIRSRGEFGVVGAGRILSLLKEFEIRSTWFIPGFTIESYGEACRAVVAGGHEIGHHGWTHRAPLSMSPEEEEADLVRGTESIRALCGTTPVGYRSPAAEFSDSTVKLLLKHGFHYDSSMMANDYTPYKVRDGDIIELGKPAIFGPETALVEIPMAWSLDDMPHFEYFRSFDGGLQQGLMNASAVYQNWLGDFEYMLRTGDWGVITYVCHPFIIGRGHRMLMLERLIRALREAGAVFLTMGEAFAEFQQRQDADHG